MMKERRGDKNIISACILLYTPFMAHLLWFDWSIEGCNIRQRALKYLYNDNHNNDTKKEIKTFLYLTNDLNLTFV